MSFDKCLLAVESRDLSQADKSILCTLVTFIALPCYYPNARTNKTVILYQHYHPIFATGGELHSKGTFPQFQVQLFLRQFVSTNFLFKFIYSLHFVYSFLQKICDHYLPWDVQWKCSFHSAVYGHKTAVSLQFWQYK